MEKLRLFVQFVAAIFIIFTLAGIFFIGKILFNLIFS